MFREQEVVFRQAADIMSYICREHLPPAAAVALALTCKPLFSLVFETARLCLDGSQRQELQLLLEKDLGHNWWYCHTCSVLHAISAQGLTGSGSRRPLGEPDSPHDSLFLCGSGFSIGYQSVRLAMNCLISKVDCGKYGYLAPSVLCACIPGVPSKVGT